jgi:hypothetical protein
MDSETKNFLYRMISVMQSITEDITSNDNRAYHRRLIRELEEELTDIVKEE